MTDQTLHQLFPLSPDGHAPQETADATAPPMTEEEIEEGRRLTLYDLAREADGRAAEEDRELDECGAWGRLAGLEF